MGGGKGSSGGSTTTVQKADPWEGQQPYLVGGIHINGVPIAGTFYEANKLYQNGQLAPEYYPGQTVADRRSVAVDATGAPDAGGQGTEWIRGYQLRDGCDSGYHEWFRDFWKPRVADA